MQVWNVLHAARWKCRTQKIAKNSSSGHHCTTLSGYIFETKARIDNRKNVLNSNISSTCLHNMVNFGPLAAKIRWRVWGTPANFNGFRVLAALLHDTLVVGVSQTLRRWAEGSTYIRQGGHHVGVLAHILVTVFCLVFQNTGQLSDVAAADGSSTGNNRSSAGAATRISQNTSCIDGDTMLNFVSYV